jgi:hypothetical protein
VISSTLGPPPKPCMHLSGLPFVRILRHSHSSWFDYMNHIW